MAMQNLRPGYPIQIWNLSILEFEKEAEVVWEEHGCLCSLHYREIMKDISPLRNGHYTGYVRFPRKYSDFFEDTADSPFYNSVPVHGGITFHRHSKFGHILGFDCAHAADENNPETLTLKYLAFECAKLAYGGCQYMDKHAVEGRKESLCCFLK